MTSARADGMDARRCASATRKLGRGRVRSLHLNDSQTPLGSNRDRHANIGAGELGEEGCAAFLSAPGLQKLPCVLETPGENREGPAREEVELAMKLRERGIAARSAAKYAGAAQPAPCGSSRQRAAAQRGRAASACSSSARSVGVCCTR